MFKDKKKKTKEVKSAKAVVQTKAYSEQIHDMLVEAELMLDRAPKTLEIRGASKKLNIAIASLAQAGKFAEVKE